MNQPDLIITHGGNCADGFAAAWTLRGKWPNTPVVTAQYGDPPPDVTGLGVLITDFSYDEETLRAMAAQAKWIHVLDHHESAANTLRKLAREEGAIKVTFDQDRSGAALAFEYAWGGGRQAPMLIQMVEDRDLWRFAIPGTREVSAVLASHPLDYAIWTDIGRKLEDHKGRAAIISEGAAIMRALRQEMEKIIDSSTRIENWQGHEVPVCNAPYAFASEIGNVLAQGRPFAVTYFDRSDGMRQVSLRSAPDGLNVAEIAESLGGGGHKHAAGVTVPSPGVEQQPESVEETEDAEADA